MTMTTFAAELRRERAFAVVVVVVMVVWGVSGVLVQLVVNRVTCCFLYCIFAGL